MKSLSIESSIKHVLSHLLFYEYFLGQAIQYIKGYQIPIFSDFFNKSNFSGAILYPQNGIKNIFPQNILTYKQIIPTERAQQVTIENMF